LSQGLGTLIGAVAEQGARPLLANQKLGQMAAHFTAAQDQNPGVAHGDILLDRLPNQAFQAGETPGFLPGGANVLIGAQGLLEQAAQGWAERFGLSGHIEGLLDLADNVGFAHDQGVEPGTDFHQMAKGFCALQGEGIRPWVRQIEAVQQLPQLGLGLGGSRSLQVNFKAVAGR
jgi:hypothetical protein